MCSPGDQDLCWGLVDLLGDFFDGWCVDNSGFTGDVVSERGVGGDDDLLLLAYSLELISRENLQYLNNSG